MQQNATLEEKEKLHLLSFHKDGQADMFVQLMAVHFALLFQRHCNTNGSGWCQL